ncbi:MAG: hypothetical protein ABEL76_11955, partial [Bradymonadaceae bacterium]
MTDAESFEDRRRELLESGSASRLVDAYQEQRQSEQGGDPPLDRLADDLEEMAREADGESAADIWLERGDICEELGDVSEASNSYQNAYSADPTTTEGLRRARSVYIEHDLFDGALNLYDVELRAVDTDRDRARVLLGKAQIEGDYRGDLREAVELAEEALEATPEWTPAEEIRNVYAAGGTIEAEIDDTARLAADARSSGDPGLAAELFAKAARLQVLHVGSGDDRARELLEEARSLRPEHPEVQAVEERYFGPGEGDEHAVAEHDAAGEASQTAVVGDRDGDGEAATEGPETAAGADEESEPTDRSDEGRQEEVEPPDEAGEPEEAESGEASEAVETSVANGEAPVQQEHDSFDREGYWSQREASDLGLDGARQRLDAEPGDVSALAVARRELREQGGDEELVERLEAALDARRGTDAEPVLLAELGELHWRQLEDWERAEYYFRRLKVHDNRHPDVLAFYEAFLEREENWRRLFSLLKVREEEADGLDERRHLAERRAEIAEEQLGSSQRAIDVWKDYLRRVDGEDDQARRRLRELFEEHELWNGLVDFLKDEIERFEREEPGAVDERIERLERLAEVYEEIGNRVMAINALQEILDLQPLHDEAFEQLRELLRGSSRWRDLATLLADRADALLEVDREAEAADLLERTAELYAEQFQNPSRAAPYLEQLLEIAPDRAEAREQLAGVYRRRRDWEALYELKREALDRAGGDADRELLDEIRRLAHDRLGEPERAAPALEALVDRGEAGPEVLRELEEVYRSRGDWERLADVLRRRADETDETSRRVDLLSKLARVLGDPLDEPQRAADVWREVLEARPEHGEAFAELTDLYLEEQRFDELEELYAERGRFSRLFDLFDSAARVRSDAAVQRDLYRRMARLAEEELGDPNRHIISLESLADVAEGEDVADELADAYQQAGDVERELEARRAQLEACEEAERRAELLDRIAALESTVDESQKAFERLIRLVQLEPGRHDALERAEHLARTVGELQTFVDEVLAIADACDDEEIRLQLLTRAAPILADELGESERALDRYEEIRDRRPEDPAVLGTLAELYAADGDAEGRVEVLRERVEVRRERDDGPSETADDLLELADALAHDLERWEEAADVYERVLTDLPGNADALHGLQDLHREREAWEDLADALQRELAVVDGADADDRSDEWRSAEAVRRELADLQRGRLDRPTDALHNYRDILDHEPQAEQAVEGLEALLENPDCAREASLLLGELFRDRGAFGRLAEVLEERIERSEDPFERAETAGELAELYRNELDDADRAFQWASRQFDWNPDDEENWDRLEALADRTGRWSDVVEQFAGATALESPEISEDRLSLLRRIAELQLQKLDDVSGAIDALEVHRERAPEDRAVADQLENLYRRAGRTESLVDLLVDRAESLDEGDQRIQRLEEAAALCEDQLDDLERAVELRYRVVQDRPADSAAVGAYERLLRETERWEALEALVEEQLDAAESDEEERDRRLELAELRGLRTGDYEGAFELLAPMVESEPVDDRAVEALEELDVALIKAASSRVDLRIEIAEVLEPIYRRRGDRDQLVYALGIQLRGIDDPERRVDLLEERADLYAEELDQPTSAFDDLAAALRIEPADADRRRRVEELAERVDRREDLIDVYAEAREGADEEVADALDRRIGRMAADLGDRSRAVEAWSRVRQRNGKDAEALEALEELYDELDRIGELAEILWKRVELADESERRPLLARLGEIERSELGRPDRAMIAYERLLDLESEAEAALDALEGLYEEHGRWFDLADALERKVEVADEDETRVGALSRLGQLCEGDELDDRPRAIEAYSRAVDIDPDCTDALRALDRLYEQTGQPDERAEVLRRRLRTAEAMDMEARREIELELADLFRADLGRPEDALELYRVVLERDTGHDRAVEGLAELVDRPDVPESAVDLLAEQYEAVEDWESLADLHRRRRDRASDREERARASYDLGRLLADSIGDEQGAVDALADAWIFAPDEETYREAAVEALEAHGDWQRAVDVRRDVLDELDDPDERVEMHLELGDLLRNRLERTVDAEEEYRRAIDIDESRPAAYDRLESILEEGERWLDLIDLVERRIEVFEDDEQERVEQIERIAEIYEGALDDPFQAADAWERLLEIRPDHRRALEQLGDLYRRQEKWQALADHLEHRLEQTEHPDEIVDLVYELAEITREHLYRPDHAVDLYEQLLEIVPGHEPTVESLEALVESDAGVRERAAELLARAYREHGRWADLVDALYEWAEAAESGEQARDRLSEAFEVARDRLEDPEAAHDVVERMLHVEPRNADVRADVRAFAEEHAAWSFLDELYESVLAEKLPPGEPGRAEVLAERAAWVEQRLEELDRAGDLFRDALAEDPSLDAAIEGLERALVRSEKWDELAEFLGERASGTDDPDRRRARLRRAGRIYERIRVDLDAAAEAYGEALDRTGPDRAILDALERIERRRGEWEELVSRLRRAVDEADDPDDRAEVRHRLGVILHRRLDSPEEAARLYADNLTDAPDSVRPVRALEELETDLADRDKDWTVLRRRIVEDLASRVDADADWERAADLAERAAALGGDPDRRSRYLLEAVEAIDAGAEQEIARLGAVERAARARAVDPGDSRAGEVLEEVVDGVGHWEVVARELSKVLEETSDPDRRAELALMAGRVYEDELDDPERAAESYRVAADSDGAEALERLERMLELLGRDEERAEVLEERIDREVEPDRRFELLERAAELYDDVLSAPERAADCYRRIVEEQPDAEDAYASLQSLYERIGDHEALAEVLERRIQAVEDESERRQLQVRLAELREDELG